MSYKVELAPAARRALRKLDPQSRRRIQAAIELMADDPRPPSAKMLDNSDGAWRVRIGDYRVIYDIHDDWLLLLVLSVGHRREIYRHE